MSTNKKSGLLHSPKQRSKQDDQFSTTTSSFNIPMRIGGGRVIKTKVPFDPSDNNFPKRRQTICDVRSSGSGGHNNDAPNKKKQKTDDRKLDQCFICKIKNDKKEQMVPCKQCTAKVHLSCLKAESQYFSPAEELNWSCEQCQLCTVCDDGATSTEPLYKCFICLNSYHLACHNPGSTTMPKIVRKNRFRCQQCKELADVLKHSANNSSNSSQESKSKTKKIEHKSGRRISARSKRTGFAGWKNDEVEHFNSFKDTLISTKTTSSSSSSSTSSSVGKSHQMQTATPVSSASNASTSSLSPITSPKTSPLKSKPHQNDDIIISTDSSGYDQMSSVDECKANSVPDITDWSFYQVHDYFQKHFPNEAQVFLKEKIDGSALLLLKRTDVVSGFDIKLGPALNIYTHVLMFQTKSTDHRLGWL